MEEPSPGESAGMRLFGMTTTQEMEFHLALK